MHAGNLRAAYDRLHEEGRRLAGDRGDVQRRAAVFYHLYRHSGRNHVFPLIAAHATLWVRHYGVIGKHAAWWLSWQYGLFPARRQEQIASMERFADALLDVNRRICAAAYADYYFTARYGMQEAAAEVIAPQLLAPLLQIHQAREAGRDLTDDEKLEVFWPHFLHEQEFHVGPGLREALANLDWPLVKFLALRPIVRFAYFPRGTWLWLGNSLSHQQRVAGGLRAFTAAASAGWQRVEESLSDYGTPPPALGNSWRTLPASADAIRFADIGTGAGIVGRNLGTPVATRH